MRGMFRCNGDLLVKGHIEKGVILYIITFLSICIGVVLGVYSVKHMQGIDKSAINKWLTEAISALQSNQLSLKSLFVDSLKNYLPIVLALWFLGLTIIGIPFIIILDLIKGYTLGFTFSFIISNYALKGFAASIFGVVLQNLIFIPCIVFLSVMSMEFSGGILKDKTMILDKNTFFRCLINYSIVYGIVFIIMIIGSGIEAIISPRMIRYFIGLILI